MTRTQNPRRTALVIGCGIGGPVAAMALQKVGIEATVFEARDGNAEFVGSFLNTASNGLDALKAIDAHHEILAHGFPTPRMVMWSGSGKRLGEVANGLRLPDGTVSITVERGHCTVPFAARPSTVGSGSRRARGSCRPRHRTTV